MLYFKVAMFLQFYLQNLAQVWHFNLLLLPQQLKRINIKQCPLQSIIDDQIAEARRMRMSATSIADISDKSDGKPKSTKFKLLFRSAIFLLTPQIKAFKMYYLNSKCFSTALTTTCQFFRAMFFLEAQHFPVQYFFGVDTEVGKVCLTLGTTFVTLIFWSISF